LLGGKLRRYGSRRTKRKKKQGKLGDESTDRWIMALPEGVAANGTRCQVIPVKSEDSHKYLYKCRTYGTVPITTLVPKYLPGKK
jgi:hypothetical protein